MNRVSGRTYFSKVSIPTRRGANFCVKVLQKSMEIMNYITYVEVILLTFWKSKNIMDHKTQNVDFFNLKFSTSALEPPEIIMRKRRKHSENKNYTKQVLQIMCCVLELPCASLRSKDKQNVFLWFLRLF